MVLSLESLHSEPFRSQDGGRWRMRTCRSLDDEVDDDLDTAPSTAAQVCALSRAAGMTNLVATPSSSRNKASATSRHGPGRGQPQVVVSAAHDTRLRRISLPAISSAQPAPTFSHDCSSGSSPASISTSPSSRVPVPDLGSKTAPNDFVFQPITVRKILDFSNIPRPSLGQSVKRRRPCTDVDGPNTATLSCKKRRLRLDLITSRLSQPYSSPATHILNREAHASGEKRFVKLAAIVASRKLGASSTAYAHPNPSSSTLMRRGAILNRFRLRVCHAAANRGDAGVAGLAANTSLLGPGYGFGQGGMHLIVSARHPDGVAAGVTAPLQTAREHASNAIRQTHPHPHPLSRAAHVVRAPPPGSPDLRPADAAASTLLPTPRFNPIPSPELRPSQPTLRRSVSPLSSQTRPLTSIMCLADDEVPADDDDVAFLANPASAYDDDSDGSDTEIYADFSVIFGRGKSADPDRDSGDAEDDASSIHTAELEQCYDEYLDDLDGIPWEAR